MHGTTLCGGVDVSISLEHHDAFMRNVLLLPCHTNIVRTSSGYDIGFGWNDLLDMQYDEVPGQASLIVNKMHYLASDNRLPLCCALFARNRSYVLAVIAFHRILGCCLFRFWVQFVTFYSMKNWGVRHTDSSLHLTSIDFKIAWRQSQNDNDLREEQSLQ